MALSAAIILAAGEGTRMRSNKPKVLHTLAGKTFLNRVMDSVAALDPDTLAVVVHYQPNASPKPHAPTTSTSPSSTRTTSPEPAAPCNARWRSSRRRTIWTAPC